MTVPGPRPGPALRAPVGRVVTVPVGLLFLAVALTALVSPRSPFTVYRQPVVVAATAVLLLLCLVGRLPPVVRTWCAWRWTATVVGVLGGAVGWVTGRSLRLDYSWDVRILLDIASRLHTGAELTRYQQGYVSRYPNNTVMVAIDRLAYAVADAVGRPVGLVLIAVAAVGVAVVVWTVHRMVLPVGGAVRAVGAQLGVVLLVAASPWLAIPYTDVLAMPFLCGGLLLAMQAMRRRHDGRALLLALAAGASIAVAATLKTIPYVVAGALVVTGVLGAVSARADRKEALRWLAGAVAAVAALALAALGVSATATAALSEVPRTKQASAPVLWWVANGMTQTQAPGLPARYGGFNAALGRAISGMPREEATQWSRDYIAAQWARRGLGGTAGFYGNKAAWNWGDGMFWAWGEGQDAKPGRLPVRHGLAGAVRAVDHPDGRWYPLRSDLTQAGWLALLAIGGAGAVLVRRPRLEVVLVATSVLGLAVFTLLFQGRSRYLFTFVPVVVALVAMVHPSVSSGVARVTRATQERLSPTRRSGSAPR